MNILKRNQLPGDQWVSLSREKGFGLVNASLLMQRLLSDSKIQEWHRSPYEGKSLQPNLIGISKKYGVCLSEWQTVMRLNIRM